MTCTEPPRELGRKVLPGREDCSNAPAGVTTPGHKTVEPGNTFEEHANLWMSAWEVESSGLEEMQDAVERGRDSGALNGATGTEPAMKPVENESVDYLQLGVQAVSEKRGVGTAASSPGVPGLQGDAVFGERGCCDRARSEVERQIASRP
jgi:hypothetical protein